MLTDARTPSTEVPTLEQRRAAYIAALKKQDWGYMKARHGAAYHQGKNSFRAIERERMAIDPDGLLWNQYAPSEKRIGTATTAAQCVAMDDTFESVIA